MTLVGKEDYYFTASAFYLIAPDTVSVATKIHSQILVSYSLPRIDRLWSNLVSFTACQTLLGYFMPKPVYGLQ